MTWLAVAVATTAAFSVVGTIQAGNAAKASADYDAQIADQNAMLARREASSQEELQRKQARKIHGRQLAAIGESGVALDGSAADIFRQSLYDAEMDSLNIRYEGELNNASAKNQAAAARFNGKQAQKSSYYSAAATIASSAAQGYASRQGALEKQKKLNG